MIEDALWLHAAESPICRGLVGVPKKETVSTRAEPDRSLYLLAVAKPVLEPRAELSQVLPLDAIRTEFQTGAVQVVFLALGCSPMATAARMLSADDRTRARRLVALNAQRAFVAGRWLLRSVLAALIGIEPLSLELRAENRGKLFLAGHERIAPCFNLSHSGDFAALALVRARRVGIDIEAERPFADRALLARRILGPRERERFETLPETAREAALLEVWTRKEAVLKALGTGIAGNLRSIEVLPEAGAKSRDELVAQSTDPPTRWSVRTLSLPTGYQGSVAVEGDGRDLVTWQVVVSGPT